MKITFGVISIIALSILIMTGLTHLTVGLSTSIETRGIEHELPQELGTPLARVEQLNRVEEQLQAIYPYLDGLYLGLGLIFVAIIVLFANALRKALKREK